MSALWNDGDKPAPVASPPYTVSVFATSASGYSQPDFIVQQGCSVIVGFQNHLGADQCKPALRQRQPPTMRPPTAVLRQCAIAGQPVILQFSR